MHSLCQQDVRKAVESEQQRFGGWREVIVLRLSLIRPNGPDHQHPCPSMHWRVFPSGFPLSAGSLSIAVDVSDGHDALDPTAPGEGTKHMYARRSSSQ